MKKQIILFFAAFLSLQSLSYAEITAEDNDIEYLKPYKKHKVVLLSDNDAYVDIYSDKYYSAAHRVEYILQNGISMEKIMKVKHHGLVKYQFILKIMLQVTL